MADQQHTLDRRKLLLGSAGLAGLLAAPTVGEAAAAAPAPAAPAVPEVFAAERATAVRATVPNAAHYDRWSGTAFVDDYLSNTTDNLSADTNAAVRILTGMEELWQSGSEWNNGVVVDTGILGENMRYCAEITRDRTDADAKQSYIFDRQHQSHSALGGLGPLEALYKTGAKAVTAITGAPDGVPDGRVSDSVPAGAPEGSATGAGSPSSDLGKVVELVNTVRGPHASSNPSKYTYQYPRPWRMSEDSEVVETGGLPVLGVPVYETDVVVASELLRQRSTNPDEDGGYPSGHANAAFLASLALAHAVPERFQELLVRASEVSHSRIVSGMHSPVDTIGGRILATALAAAVLYDEKYAELRSAARQQALEYFTAATGADDLYSYAHREGIDTDKYADHAANRAAFEERLTYFLERDGDEVEMTVPKGAEALLATRLPYLDADQQREVLRTTALPSGYALLQGPEQWGRLNLFAAADGYGRFDGDVRVIMDAAQGGFAASDVWRNDIAGSGKLHKVGSGTLTLSGDNAFKGGVYVEDGTIRAASPTALGKGNVEVKGGALALDPAAGQVQAESNYTQAGAALEITVNDGETAPLKVAKTLSLETGSVLRLRLDPQRPPAAGVDLPLAEAKKIKGTFTAIELDFDGYTATAAYESKRITVRIDAV